MRRSLEREVLATLWDAPEGLAAAEIVPRLDPPQLAVTTVLTVLERLRAKELVSRTKQGREFRYRATTSAPELLARLMASTLDEGADRRLVLARFVAALTDSDQLALRELVADERQLDD